MIAAHQVVLPHLIALLVPVPRLVTASTPSTAMAVYQTFIFAPLVLTASMGQVTPLLAFRARQAGYLRLVQPAVLSV